MGKAKGGRHKGDGKRLTSLILTAPAWNDRTEETETKRGAGRIVTEDYEDVAVKLDYNADDNLGGFDRFGRVVDQLWTDYGANPAVTVDRYTYAYDRAGNRTAKNNALHAAFDEDYTYDNLDRLATTTRADGFDQDWTLDGLGNWSAFDDDGSAQTRTANAANEITGITGGSVVPEYDAAGNMIAGPKPGDETTRLHYVHDAWNRLVEVWADNEGQPSEPLASYEYDAQNRRIQKDVGESERRHFYYNDRWQCVEERTEDMAQPPGAIHDYADCQYVWSAGYVDDLILRERDANHDGTMDERLYALRDANYNVTALADADGDVVERFVYDAYGETTVLDDDFTPMQYGDEFAWDYLYTGRQLDNESGLMYYRNRYYHTGLGSFVSRDPIGYASMCANLYEYVYDSPINFLDPSGLQFIPFPGGSPGFWPHDYWNQFRPGPAGKPVKCSDIKEEINGIDGGKVRIDLILGNGDFRRDGFAGLIRQIGNVVNGDTRVVEFDGHGSCTGMLIGEKGVPQPVPGYDYCHIYKNNVRKPGEALRNAGLKSPCMLLMSGCNTGSATVCGSSLLQDLANETGCSVIGTGGYKEGSFTYGTIKITRWSKGNVLCDDHVQHRTDTQMESRDDRCYRFAPNSKSNSSAKRGAAF